MFLFDRQVQNILLVARRKASKNGDDLEQARLGTIRIGIRGYEKSGQPSTKSLDADLQIVVAGSHGGRDEILILKTAGLGLVGDKVILKVCAGAAHGERLLGDWNSMFKSEHNIADTVPHGIDLK